MARPKNQDLETFEAFEQVLYEGLTHLNEPIYQPPALFVAGAGDATATGPQGAPACAYPGH